MSEFCDILKLAELFHPNKENESDSEDEIDNTYIKSLGPGDLNKDCQVVENAKEEDEYEEDTKTKEIDPDNEDALYFDKETVEISDWRKCPQWNVSYRQQVSASDVFLQMGGKTPSTASCEDMIIDVHLPGESRQNIDLKITCQRMELVSPKFRLAIPLPHPVDPQKGNAQWDADAEKLIVTLKMMREFDYINF